MPRAKKTDKFYINKMRGRRSYGNHLVGINRLYEGDPKNLTLQAFVDFLKEHGIDPAKVKCPVSFGAIFITK